MKFADPKNDIAFKKIFGDENHKEVLISFLNSILNFKNENKIVDVILVNPYQVPKIEELKETILDIKATNKKGEHFIVEMQKNDKGDFAKRSLYYTSKAYVNQLNVSYNYKKLQKVYFIGIVNFNIFDNINYISRHLILNIETKIQDIADFEFNFIELKKFNKRLNELNTILDKWIYFIKNASNLTLIPKEFKDKKEFIKAFEIASQYNWNKKELEVYEYIALKEFDRLNEIETAEEKGRMKGRIEGKIEGKIEGLREGEKNKQVEIAKNLLDVLDVETIALKTGLSVEDIEKLREK